MYVKIAEDVRNASKNSFKSFVCQKNELISHYRSRRQGSWVGDDILKKDVYNVLFLTYQNVGNFEIGVENEIKVDVCVVCVYTRSMHLPLNGKVYGVVRNIYIISAGSTLLVTPMGSPTTLIGGK